VKEQGAHHALNHSVEGYLDELMKLTDGRGVDVIVELLATRTWRRTFVLAKKGRVAVIGSRGSIEINPRDAMSREADIARDPHEHVGAGVSRDARRTGR